MSVKLTQKEKEEKIYENSLHTCVYVSGECKKGHKIKVRCLIHDIVFEIGYDAIRHNCNKHLICPECKRLERDGTQKLTCDYCGKEYTVKKCRLKDSQFHFCCRDCKDKAQRISSGEKFNSLRPSHYSKDAVKQYRETAFNTYEHKCAICGWNEDEDVLEVHHIDANRNNNNLDNLIILCPTCHKKLTLHKYVLVDRKKIIKK